jgi:hypothetical protein
MSEWLRAALVKSLPGEEGAWPEAPVFSQTAEVRVARKEVAEEVKPAAEVQATQPRAAKTQAKEAPEVVAAAKPVVAPSTVTPPVVTKQIPPRATNADVAKRAAPTVAEAAGAYKGVKAAPIVAKTPATADRRQAETIEPVKVEAAKPAPAPVAVNLAELNARIGGYHEGLREIEAAMVVGREEMSVGQIAKSVGQLEQLAGHYQFVRLYYDSLTREEKQAVTEPRTMAETVELVERERARVEVAGDENFLASNEVVEEGELAMRLKALAEVAERRGKRCCD